MFNKAGRTFALIVAGALAVLSVVYPILGTVMLILMITIMVTTLVAFINAICRAGTVRDD